MTNRTLCAAALIALVCISAPAFAQATVVDMPSIFGAWRPYVTELVGVVVAAVVGYALKLLRDRFSIEIEARHREALQTALTNGAGLLIAKAEDAAGALKLDLGNPALAEAVNYVLKGAPDALAYFGLGAHRVREMLIAKVGVVAAAADA